MVTDDPNKKEVGGPEEKKPGLDNDVTDTPRSDQDTIPVDGEQVIHMPEGSELVERGNIQG